MNLEKMKKMAAGLEKFAGVLQKIIVICMIAAVCVVAVLTVANMIKPDIPIGEMKNTVDMGHITVEVETDSPMDNRVVLTLAWITVALNVVYVAGIWYILKIFRRILLPMKEGNPFSDAVSKDIRKTGWAVVGLGVISNLGTLLEAISEWITLVPRLAEGSLGSYIIRSVAFTYTVDIGFLVIFAILMLVAWIFEYGAELQKLSDETL